MNPRPIGVFDSGIGGLTVVRELLHQLPHESLVYFGDTARVPYGNKSPDTVRRYSGEILEFLEGRDVKMVVVACNTATAHALDDIRRAAKVPALGVIEPGARAAARATKTGRIGVIGTAGTVKSGAYTRAVHKESPGATVVEQACPLFVPLVEEGWLDTPATTLIAEEYLAPVKAAEVDTLVLGCTHYPLLKRLIGDVMGAGVTLIDSAEETAAEVARLLGETGTRAPDHGAARADFVVSDGAATFQKLGAAFLGDRVTKVETVPLGEHH